MSGDPLELDQIQRWLQAVITHPQGIEAGIRGAEAQAEIPVSSGDLGRVVPRSRNLTSVERLRVYGNAYFARLLECLQEEFPALRHALGDEAFDGLAVGYLVACPPRSYTLGQLGARFPAYLEDTRPNEPGPGGRPAWSDFFVDLARLERIYSEVFDGPGVEGRTLLQADDILAIPPELWAGTRLTIVPCLRLVRLSYPVQEYATAVKKNEQPAIPEPRPTFLAVSRRDYVVRRWSLAAVEFALLEALVRGESVGAVIQHISDDPEAAAWTSEEFGERLGQWFRDWTAAGFFDGVGTS